MKNDQFGVYFPPIDLTCDIEYHQFGPLRPTLVKANFKETALLWSQFVLAWVQRIFGSTDTGNKLPPVFYSLNLLRMDHSIESF